jgi:HK97 family phage major capsid protein
MPYNNVISRTDVVIPVEYSRPMIEGAREQSAALQLFRRAPNMAAGTVKMPVLSALPFAYFTGGDTGLKQTTELNWTNRDLVAEEIACIVPIPEAVANDLKFNVWDQVRPFCEEAIGRTLDGAIFFGTNKPASWPAAVITQAVSVGNVVARGTNAAAAGGVMGDLSDLMEKVETDGFAVNGFVGESTFAKYFRKARATDGQRLLDVEWVRRENGRRVAEVEGVPFEYAMQGLWPSGASAAEVVAGDFQQGIIAIREDISAKLLTEAVITDNSVPPQIIYNLPQQDMIALRLTLRVAWTVSNRVNWKEAVEANRWPWAVLRSPAA